jgi:CelD/BcsL family acetyltransferase involved in cellulose biosynthesis
VESPVFHGLVLLRIYHIPEVIESLRLVVLKEIAEDTSLWNQWNELIRKLDQPQVFHTYEWALAVQRAYSATLSPLVFLAYDDRNSLCGLTALAIDSECTRASFLCATTGDYCDFLAMPEYKVAFVSAVLADLRSRGIGEITLTNLPADSATLSAIQQHSTEYGYRSFARTAYICAQVSLRKLERQAGKKPVLPGQRTMRRKLKALGSPVRLDHACSWSEVGPILPEFAQAHISCFQATGRVSNLARPERRLFLEELAKLLSEPGWLILTRLMTGDQAIAWNYGFQFEGVWFWYQPTFDTDLERFSPGSCLLAKLIEEASENPAMHMVDLGLGAEGYKERFANETRETLYVTLRSSTAKHIHEIVRYHAAQLVKASPRLEANVRKMVAGLRRLVERKSAEE